MLENLNKEQLRAVTSKARHQLVLAGAGSGKTRVLTYRIAWLITQCGIAPESILAVTFTNKAANEMRSRITQHIGKDINSLWVGTFHAIALRLLKANWREAGLESNFKVIGTEDQLRYLRRLCHETIGHDIAGDFAKNLREYINTAKEQQTRADAVPVRSYQSNDTLFRELYQKYEEECQREGLVDFAELLLRATELWQKSPEVLSRYQNRFRYLLVDEFQDTNQLQYQWLTTLAGPETHMMVVGDDDQSIYRWRGARVENILEFDHHFAEDGVDVVSLEQNYRSTKTVLSAANAVITKNAKRHAKTLWTEDVAGAPITLYRGSNEMDEAQFAVDQLLSMREKGESLSDVAIMYRSHAQSRVFEEELNRASINYRVHGGTRFYDRVEIRDFLCWLRVVTNPDDNFALERAVAVPRRGVGERSLIQLRAMAKDGQCSIWRVLHDESLKAQLRPQARKGLEEFVERVEKLRREIVSCKSLEKIANTVLAASGLMEYYQERSGADSLQVRVDNMKELISACAQYDERGTSVSMDDFLNQIALEAGDFKRSETDNEMVQLMTIHAAKGLEFDVVFLVGMEENLIPHINSLDKPAQLEEERRLCYVAITRTKRKLYCLYANQRKLYGQSRSKCTPSRFLNEIPRNLILNLNKSGSTETTSNSQSMNRLETRQRHTIKAPDVPVSDDGELVLGARVMHRKFGEGTVIGLEGQGEHARVRVHFVQSGHKWLVPSFARLQVIGLG